MGVMGVMGVINISGSGPLTTPEARGPGPDTLSYLKVSILSRV